MNFNNKFILRMVVSQQLLFQFFIVAIQNLTMQELSHLQLIESFKSFVTACQISMKMPQEFEKKWLIFSHYLNIYPLHSMKLTEYSHKCADEDLERKFIQENLLQFSCNETPEQREQIVQASPRMECNQSPPQENENKPSAQKKNQKTLQTLSASIKVTIQKMRNGTKFFKDRIIETRRANNIDQSTTSMILNETFKRVDANQLRQKIVVLKDDLKKQQEEEKRVLQFSPMNDDYNCFSQSAKKCQLQLSQQKISKPQNQNQPQYQSFQGNTQQGYQYSQQQQNIYPQQQNRQINQVNSCNQITQVNSVNYSSQPQKQNQNRQQLLNNQQQRMILQQNRQIPRQPMQVYPHQASKQVASRIT